MGKHIDAVASDAAAVRELVMAAVSPVSSEVEMATMEEVEAEVSDGRKPKAKKINDVTGLSPTEIYVDWTKNIARGGARSEFNLDVAGETIQDLAYKLSLRGNQEAVGVVARGRGLVPAFEVRYGYRRVAAANLIVGGFHYTPPGSKHEILVQNTEFRLGVVKLTGTEKELIRANLTENQKIPLSPYDKACQVENLREVCKWSPKEIFEATGIKAAYQTELLKLLLIPERFQKAFQDGSLKVSDRTLMKITELLEDEQAICFDKIMELGEETDSDVPDLEEVGDSGGGKKKKKKKWALDDAKDLIQNRRDRLGVTPERGSDEALEDVKPKVKVPKTHGAQARSNAQLRKFWTEVQEVWNENPATREFAKKTLLHLKGDEELTNKNYGNAIDRLLRDAMKQYHDYLVAADVKGMAEIDFKATHKAVIKWMVEGLEKPSAEEEAA